MLFFFHHYELPAILSQAHQLEPEDDLLADPINLLTDEHVINNQQQANQANNNPLPLLNQQLNNAQQNNQQDNSTQHTAQQHSNIQLNHQQASPQNTQQYTNTQQQQINQQGNQENDAQAFERPSCSEQNTNTNMSCNIAIPKGSTPRDVTDTCTLYRGVNHSDGVTQSAAL